MIEEYLRQEYRRDARELCWEKGVKGGTARRVRKDMQVIGMAVKIIEYKVRWIQVIHCGHLKLE